MEAGAVVLHFLNTRTKIVLKWGVYGCFRSLARGEREPGGGRRPRLPEGAVGNAFAGRPVGLGRVGRQAFCVGW